MLFLKAILCMFFIKGVHSLQLSTKRTFTRSLMSEFASNLAATGSASSSTPSVIVSNTDVVKARMIDAAIKCNRSPDSIRLVAVSKTKPSSDIMQLYEAGHRSFGENYFQELLEKSELLPKDIKWHFIGHLQSQKASKLVKDVTGLAVVETVDTLKLAKKLNNACESAERLLLDIYIQVDTSGEDTKSGVPPSEVVSLVQSIKQECPRLCIAGLMTIGAPGDLSCFDRLVETRIEVAEALSVSVDSLALSMGMSGDFQDAISKGSTSIRVGSTIFGERIYPEKSSS